MLAAGLCVLVLTSSFDDLKSRLHPISSPTHVTEKECAAIGKAIGNARIVMLGELTHGDSESHSLKVELIKYLHRSKGFDVLVWESGLYDCWKMDAELGGKQPIEKVASMGVFGHWSQGKEAFPIFEYARSTRSGKRPLIMTGFDIQESGSAAYQMFPEFLEWFGDRKELTPEDRRVIKEAFDLAASASKSAQGPEAFQIAHEAVLSTATRFKKALDSNPAEFNKLWGAEAGIRRRSIESAVHNAAMMKLYGEMQKGKGTMAAPYNLREKGNAENLVWLANERYKNKKLIVWAHNVHLFRGLPGRGAGSNLIPQSGDLDSTGRLVAKSLGDQIYSIGFMAAGGKWSWMGNAPINFRAPSSAAIESKLSAVGSDVAFLDLKELPTNHALRMPMPGTIDQQNPIELTTVWPDGFDALIFIKRMTPRQTR